MSLTSRLLVVTLGTLGLALAGCKSIPEGRSSVDAVEIRGNDAMSDAELEEKIATTATPKFLGLFRGVLFEYSTFDRFVLQRDLARVEAYYRSKGYFDAHARAGRVHVDGDEHVRVEVIVEEGKPVTLREPKIEGLDGLPAEDVARVRRAVASALPVGRVFTDEEVETTETTVRRALSDHGFAHAKVQASAKVDLVERRADVLLRVRPGPRCTFGKVTLTGNGDLPASSLLRTVDIAEGSPYSEAALEGARQALLDLGVLAGVQLVPEGVDIDADDEDGGEDGGEDEDGGNRVDGASAAEDGAAPVARPGTDTSPPVEKARPAALATVVPIKVEVEPSRVRAIRLGAGIEFDSLKSDVHGIIGWEHRNFLGGLRSFSVAFRPGVVFFPLRFGNFVAPEKPLLEQRLRVELKQPGALEARTTAFLRPEFNVNPVLLPGANDDSKVLGYAEFRAAAGLERMFWRLFASISHNLQVAYPFPYVGPRNETLGLVTLSYPELVTTLDLRDDKIHPRRGVFLGNTLQVAGGPFGGDARDIKVQPEVRFYIPLGKRVVLASRGSVGFLAPSNYGDIVRDPRSASTPDSVDKTRDYQITFFRGFFSGGPTQNRGYPIRGVGPYAIVPFLNPDFALQQVDQRCVPGVDGMLPTRCTSPTGGFSLWEASLEVRFSITGPLSAATFCDASDVSPRTMNLRFNRPHLSCGGGARYDTPVGPIRLDIGYRIPGMQVIGEDPTDEKAPIDFFGAPIAVHIGIGEAY